jgi:hypothetical protein
MTLKPSARRVAAAAALAALFVVLDYFLPSPHLNPVSLGWSIVMGLVIGYLMWPWFESIQYSPGYFQPTLPRLFKTVIAGGIGALILAALNIVSIGNRLSAEGLLVSFLFIAALVYIKLGNTPRSRS